MQPSMGLYRLNNNVDLRFRRNNAQEYSVVTYLDNALSCRINASSFPNHVSLTNWLFIVSCSTMACEHCCRKDANGIPFCGDLNQCYIYTIAFSFIFFAYTIFVVFNVFRSLRLTKLRQEKVFDMADRAEKYTMQ